MGNFVVVEAIYDAQSIVVEVQEVGAKGDPGGAYMAFGVPKIFHADGNTVNGVIQPGDYIEVRTFNPDNNVDDTYIFKGYYIQGEVDDYFNTDNYTEKG